MQTFTCHYKMAAAYGTLLSDNGHLLLLLFHLLLKSDHELITETFILSYFNFDRISFISFVHRKSIMRSEL